MADGTPTGLFTLCQWAALPVSNFYVPWCNPTFPGMNSSPVMREVKLQYLQIPIKTYSKPAVPCLQSVIIQPLKHSNQEPACLRSAFALDSLWVSGYILEIAPCPSRSGFMKVAVKNDQYEKSRIVTLPYINFDQAIWALFILLSVRRMVCKSAKLHLTSLYTLRLQRYVAATQQRHHQPSLMKTLYQQQWRLMLKILHQMMKKRWNLIHLVPY